MITWMQRHKKYLVITIWISTIAFVGAGFVGWGAYDFNTDRNNAVAIVGDKKITISEFQTAYSNYFAYYNSIFNNELTIEQAENLGLDKIVLENLVNEALLLNYANQLGLYPTDEEVKKLLVNDENFQTNGVFDKELYYNALRNARVTPSAYEDGLKKQAVLNKLAQIIDLKPNQNELQVLNDSLFMSDKLEVKVLDLPQDGIKYTDEQLKTFWEANKSKFLTQPSYTTETIFVSSEDKQPTEDELKAFWDENKFKYREADGKIKTYENASSELLADTKKELARKEALTKYVAFRKGEISADKNATYFDSDAIVDFELLENTKAGEILKPTETDDGFVIIKLISRNTPEPMSFEEAKAMVIDSYKEEKRVELLTNMAKDELQNFKGEDIGFVKRGDNQKIKGLSEIQSVQFVADVFNSNQKNGYVILDDKAVVYKVLEQKLSSELNKNYLTLLEDNLVQIKNNEINSSLVQALRKRYRIEYFYKGI